MPKVAPSKYTYLTPIERINLANEDSDPGTLPATDASFFAALPDSTDATWIANIHEATAGIPVNAKS